MADQGVKLFLSCVSDEFGVYRDELRRKLTRPNVEMKIQEDFKALGGDTLSMLEEYIEHCDAVVHFAGSMTGSMPKDFCVAELLARRPDLKTRLPPLGAALDAGAKISYTQWEAWLAIYFRKDLVIAAPEQGFVRDPKIATKDSEEAQAAHLKRLREIGRYAEVRFTDKNDLVAQIFASAVIKALVRAQAMPARQPRNLPFASLGPLFVGRDKALDDLRAVLSAGKGAAVVGRALHGLGGIGKTRLAIEYAWRYEADYSSLLFVRADDPATLDANLAALAAAEVLDLEEKEAPQDAAKIEAALRWLDAHPTWLMILDNVDDEQAVAAVANLMARLKGGHVIVTARAANFPASLRKLELEVLDEDFAKDFLLERTRDDRSPSADDEEQAREIARELGGLALGLEQAGAYIAAERIGFARYLKLWRDSREKILGWFDRALTSYDHDTGLAATWATSVDRLSPESRRLLDRLAMLAPDPIPDSLLDVAVPGEAADYDAHKARAGLYAYSLITRAGGEDDTTRGFLMHRLVQDFARHAMTEERRSAALREALVWVDDAFLGDPQDVRTWPALDPLVPHALAVSRRADEAAIAVPTASLLNGLGILFSRKARYAEAEPLYRRALAIDQGSCGPDHPNVARDLNNLAELLRETNRLGEAEPLYHRALEIDEASYGPDHPNVARDVGNLAILLHQMKRVADAEPLYRRALAIGEARHRPDHLGVVEILNNLAGLLRETNRPREAEPLLRRALAIGEARYGPHHPTVATTLSNLGLLLHRMQRVGEAERHYRRALAIHEASFGPDHPEVASDLNNLAGLLRETKRLREAELLIRRALAIFEKSHGANHPHTVRARKGVAVVQAEAAFDWGKHHKPTLRR
jgi:tetratricopeptide (TPR) repeat protein